MIRLDDPRDLHYLLHVRRVKRDDAVECFDGAGATYQGTVTSVSRRAITLAMRPQVPPIPSRSPSITLAQAIPKGSRFEWVLQKATELGVSRIVPLLTRRTVIRTVEGRGRKRQRWQRIVEESAKQCGRADLPHLAAPQPFDAFLASVGREALLLLPTLATVTRPLHEVVPVRPVPPEVILAIGPEGDFTPEEVGDAQRRGAQPVSLGPLTLRSETAAVAALAMVHYAFASMPHAE